MCNSFFHYSLLFPTGWVDKRYLDVAYICHIPLQGPLQVRESIKSWKEYRCPGHKFLCCLEDPAMLRSRREEDIREQSQHYDGTSNTFYPDSVQYKMNTK
jgi:hypothetical protein